jgi:hypothetical protein
MASFVTTRIGGALRRQIGFDAHPVDFMGTGAVVPLRGVFTPTFLAAVPVHGITASYLESGFALFHAVIASFSELNIKCFLQLHLMKNLVEG